MFDELVDKATVRSIVTIFVCKMGETAGQSNIVGESDCAGGPAIMLTNENEGSFHHNTLAHELGHYFGLHHVFNEDCGDIYTPCANMNEICDASGNKGDNIADTPVYKKQEKCVVGSDSCPNSPGLDPIDNVMSYSGCQYLRFTPNQAEKMQGTIAKYYSNLITA